MISANSDIPTFAKEMSEKTCDSAESVKKHLEKSAYIYHKIPGNFICSFHVPSVDKELAPQFMKNLLDSHHEILFLTKENKIEKFQFCLSEF